MTDSIINYHTGCFTEFIQVMNFGAFFPVVILTLFNDINSSNKQDEDFFSEIVALKFKDIRNLRNARYFIYVFLEEMERHD